MVTGGASGIGAETAHALTAAGAEVVLAVRDLKTGSEAANDIAAKTGNANVRAALPTCPVPGRGGNRRSRPTISVTST